MGLRSILSTVAEAALGLVYPLKCPQCGAFLGTPHPTGFCEDCLSTLELIRGPVCPQCGLPPSHRPGFKTESRPCSSCRKRRWSGLVMVRSLSLFEGHSRRLIHRLKYEEEPWIGISIGRLMADQRGLWSQIPDPDWILPVPLHDSRHQERGYNQSEIIAREMGLRLGWPVRTDVLRKIRKTPAQMELAAERREANVRGAFASTGSLKGSTVLLVDDVATTCATLKSCGRSLMAAGAREVFGLTWARQPLESS